MHCLGIVPITLSVHFMERYNVAKVIFEALEILTLDNTKPYTPQWLKVATTHAIWDSYVWVRGSSIIPSLPYHDITYTHVLKNTTDAT